MLDELIERLAIKLAKADGLVLLTPVDSHKKHEGLAIKSTNSDEWIVTPIDTQNSRFKMYLKKAADCLEEINNFLQEEGIEFDDLEVNAKHEV